MKTRYLLLPLLVAAVLLVSACATKVTGGGWITSPLEPGAMATIALTFECTEILDGPQRDVCTAGRVRGVYHDPGRSAAYPHGVRFKLDGLVTAGADAGFQDHCMGGMLRYTSIGPVEGLGAAAVFACDNGESGLQAGDTITIRVLSGPYVNYLVNTTLQGGNFQAH